MIITAGEALVDLVPHAVPGGGPMNTAVACARLGAPTAFLGAVSTDEHGDALHAVANLGKRLFGPVTEAAVKEQVFRRVAADAELGKYYEVGA